ncbi:MAG: hypothetical protein J6J35_06920 [Alphaproteobacteria bacterium]|nr:hypothetical protein [Alphaproteobacteria bacterium]MBP3688074.1 hypothetical protein [Alphaproteobacteria bacterium]
MATTKSLMSHKGIARDVLACFYQKSGKKVSFYLADKRFKNGEIGTVVLLGFAEDDKFRELETGAVFYPERNEPPSPAAYLPCEDGFVFFAPQTEETAVSLEKLIDRYGYKAIV